MKKINFPVFRMGAAPGKRRPSPGRPTLRGVFSLTLALLFSVHLLPSFQAEAVTYKVPFDIASEAVYLVNTDTDSVIYEKNAEATLHPASLAKIMTAILAIEAVPDLAGTMVTAPAYIYDELFLLNASTADIRPRETVSMEDLLYALILPSACEAASIIADYVGNGSIDAFVDSMNRKAMELGCQNTHFTNAHGLDDPEQITTAKDMYLITQHALTFPIFEKIANTTKYVMPVTDKHPSTDLPWTIYHTNKMLVKGSSYYYEGVAGIKTGSTPDAGRNLVSAASKAGYHYLLITMGAPYTNPDGSNTNLSFVDQSNLYDWAFENFEFQTIMKEDDVVDEIHVSLSAEQDFVTLVAKQDVTTLLPSEADASTIQQNITLRDGVTAPVTKGDVLGKVELRLANDVIASVDLVASKNVKRSPWLYALDVTKRFFQQPLAQLLIVALAVAVFLYFVFIIRYNKIKQKQRERNRRYRQR